MITAKKRFNIWVDSVDRKGIPDEEVSFIYNTKLKLFKDYQKEDCDDENHNVDIYGALRVFEKINDLNHSFLRDVKKVVGDKKLTQAIEITIDHNGDISDDSAVLRKIIKHSEA